MCVRTSLARSDVRLLRERRVSTPRFAKNFLTRCIIAPCVIALGPLYLDSCVRSRLHEYRYVRSLVPFSTPKLVPFLRNSASRLRYMPVARSGNVYSECKSCRTRISIVTIRSFNRRWVIFHYLPYPKHRGNFPFVIIAVDRANKMPNSFRRLSSIFYSQAHTVLRYFHSKRPEMAREQFNLLRFP